MATVASRLTALSGLSGVTMAQHLKAIAAGTTVAAVLAAHSGLTNATMAQHLLVDKQTAQQPVYFLGGGYYISSIPDKRKDRDEEYALLLAVGVL